MKDAYFEIRTEIDRIRNISNKFILIGDFNSKIFVKDGSICSESRNGNIMKDFIQEDKLTVHNFNEKCSGKWTRQNTGANRKEKSD